VAKKLNNQALRRFHARGKHAHEVGEERKTHRQGVWRTAASLGASTATEQHRMQEARRFARVCDDKELDALCALGDRKGRPITKLQVLQLIRVANQRKRSALARKCAEGRWSVRRLQLEIDRLVPRRQYGGRRQAQPHTVEEALLVSSRLAGSVIRWVSVLRSPASKRVRGKLPRSITTKLYAIAEAAEVLCASVDFQLKKNSSKPLKKRHAKKAASVRK
jgi:hypothetical protein